MKLGKREIDALTCPVGRRDVIVFDDALPGFGLRVTAKGAKTFLLQYQLGGRRGKRTRMVLGPYGEITPVQARKLAEVARAKLRLGQDPAGERKALFAATAAATEARDQARVADEFTFGVLIQRWADQGLADRSPAHRSEAPRALRTAFATVIDRSAHALDAKTLQPLLDDIAKSRPIAARRTRNYGRAAFNWAVSRNLVAANPFATVVLDAREQSRDRVLSDAELGEAWCAAASTGYPYGAMVQILILTLQRRGEVAGMRWVELAPDLTVWTIPGPRVKNRKGHIVHLAEPARAILRALPRANGQVLVFTTADPVPMSGFSKAAEELRALIVKTRPSAPKGQKPAPAPDWRWHDFRRTGVTGLVRLGVATHVADRLLNHVQGSIRGVAAVYQRYDFMAEREAALQAWGEHVLAAVKVTGK